MHPETFRATNVLAALGSQVAIHPAIAAAPAATHCSRSVTFASKMTSKASRIRIVITNPPEGCRNTTSLAHARRYERRGIARIVGGQLVFLHRRDESKGERFAPDVVVRVGDSGVRGFTRYPMPVQTSSGLRFPALARRGAGL